jgi:hypothetical protein
MSKRDKTVDMTDEMKTADKKEKERRDTLQKYVSDMMAVEEHIGSALKRQVQDDNLGKHNSQASHIINNIAQTTERHEQALKRHLEAIGGDAAKGIKEVATAAMGTLAGLYDKVRTEAVSKMLRDDYTALNLATIGYTMLHTTGLALNDQATAALALRHLQAYTSIVMEINQIIPSVVVADLRDDGAVINESVLQQAVTNTQEAWQPSGDNSNSDATSSQPRPTTSKRASSENAVASRKPGMTTNKRTASKSATANQPSSTSSERTSSEANSKRALVAGRAKGNTK